VHVLGTSKDFAGSASVVGDLDTTSAAVDSELTRRRRLLLVIADAADDDDTDAHCMATDVRPINLAGAPADRPPSLTALRQFSSACDAATNAARQSTTAATSGDGCSGRGG